MSPGRPPPGRRVTFREPEVELNSEGVCVEDYLPEPPVSDVETWLEWQACQIEHTSMVVRAYSHSGGEGPR